jgi:hypothetical protein
LFSVNNNSQGFLFFYIKNRMLENSIHIHPVP